MAKCLLRHDYATRGKMPLVSKLASRPQASAASLWQATALLHRPRCSTRRMFANPLFTYGVIVKQFSSMNVDELLAVKAKIEAAIASRIAQERKRLTASLERLNSLANKTNGAPSKARANGLNKRRTLAAKYRNPSNPKETWAGRGHKPRWLVAALKGGKKKLIDFQIDRKGHQ
jgi:DNA-binding protein H-NS